MAYVYAVATMLQHDHDGLTFTYTLLTLVPVDYLPLLTYELVTDWVLLTT